MSKKYEIDIKKETENSFNVNVINGTATNHKVELSEDYYQKLTSGKISKEGLIKKSFEFLLKRESNTSILESFELQKIAYYFPEYESELGNLVKRNGCPSAPASDKQP